MESVGFDQDGISSSNDRRAAEIQRRAEALDRTLGLDGRLRKHITSSLAVFRWAHPFRRGERPPFSERNEAFDADLDRTEEVLRALESGEAAFSVPDETLRAHELAASLKEEAREFHEEEGTPIDWLPATRQLGEMGIYDDLVDRALVHLVLDDYGCPRWDAMAAMGRIGHEAFLAPLQAALGGRFRNPSTPGSANLRPALRALLCLGERSDRAIECLRRHRASLEVRLATSGEDAKLR